MSTKILNHCSNIASEQTKKKYRANTNIGLYTLYAFYKYIYFTYQAIYGFNILSSLLSTYVFLSSLFTILPVFVFQCHSSDFSYLLPLLPPSCQ
jgi:hypothetical protein